MIAHIPVLLYHRIAEPEENTSLCVSPKDFMQHMEYLHAQGYRVVSLDSAVDYLQRKKKLDAKTVVLTFDDGYEDFYSQAYPILRTFGFNATVFLVADYVERTNVWDHRDGWPQVRLMSWRQVNELSKKGVSFGVHSRTHKPLVKVRFVTSFYDEIKIAKRIIENRIGSAVKAFSYPYGKQNRLTQWLVKVSGYEYAVSTRRGINTFNTNPYCLNRIEINTHNANIHDFIRVIKLTEQQLYPKFRILQVVTCGSWGGQEMQAVYLSESLKEKGHEVIIACRRDGPVRANAESLGLRTFHLHVHASGDLLALLRLFFVIIRERIDIVHVHPAKDYWPAVVAARLLGRCVVVSRHLLTVLRTATRAMLNRLAHKIIAVSEATKRSLMENGGISAKKIAVIYNGVDTQQYSPLIDSNGYRKELNMDTATPLICSIGRMGCKGQTDLLYAMKKIIKVFPEVRCLLVSEFPYPHELDAQMQELKLRDYVFFRGFQSDIPRILATIDILVNVPVWEAFGLVLVEAMASAKPVVASNVGGIPEVVQDKYNGLLVPARNPEALAEALIYLIKHKKEAAEMGDRGRALVVSRFDLKDTVDNTEEVYSEVFYKFA